MTCEELHIWHIINLNWMQSGQHCLLWATFTCSRLTLSVRLLQAKLGFFKASMLLLFTQSGGFLPCLLFVLTHRHPPCSHEWIPLPRWFMRIVAFVNVYFIQMRKMWDVVIGGVVVWSFVQLPSFSPRSIWRCRHSKTHYNPCDLLPWRSAKLCVLESWMAAKRVAPGCS